jgi:hypothetical protein
MVEANREVGIPRNQLPARYFSTIQLKHINITELSRSEAITSRSDTNKLELFLMNHLPLQQRHFCGSRCVCVPGGVSEISIIQSLERFEREDLLLYHLTQQETGNLLTVLVLV